jgi:hypothetical protein
MYVNLPGLLHNPLDFGDHPLSIYPCHLHSSWFSLSVDLGGEKITNTVSMYGFISGVCKNGFFSLRWEFGKTFKNQEKDKNCLYQKNFFILITIYNNDHIFTVHQSIPLIPFDTRSFFNGWFSYMTKINLEVHPFSPWAKSGREGQILLRSLSVLTFQL